MIFILNIADGRSLSEECIFLFVMQFQTEK